jgi:hypothetical protein
MSYFYNNVPIVPGAYLVNGDTGFSNEMYQLPIFSSISDLAKMGYQNVDNTYYVLPGYKIELFNLVDYEAPIETINNTSGTKILYKLVSTINTCSSIKLYYNTVFMDNKYTYTPYTSNPGTPTTPTPTTAITIGSYKSLGLSLFPGAYVINSTGIGCMPIFFSITNFEAFLPGTDNKEDYVIVMPGYQLILYLDNNYAAGNYIDIDNTTGTTIIVGQSDTAGTGGWNNNTRSSCKLFFNKNEVNRADIVS